MIFNFLFTIIDGIIHIKTNEDSRTMYDLGKVFTNCSLCVHNGTLYAPATSECNISNCLLTITEGGNNSSNFRQNQTDAGTEYFTERDLIVFHCAYVILLLVGILGNGLTCYVIIQRKSMRRAIHLYTFNLAVADLLILIFYVPNQMVLMQNQFKWVLGAEMCKINYMVLPVALHSSIGTLLAITIDRCRGLVTPFSWRADSKFKAKILIPIVWVLSLTLSSPLFVYPRVATFSSGKFCVEGWPSVNAMRWFWMSNFVLVFGIPLLVITTTQVIMVAVVAREITNRKQNQRMVAMVIALVVVFTICTGFQHIYFFIGQFSRLRMTNSTKAFLYLLSNFVVSLQAALNPIIYGTLRRDFKKAFLHVLVAVLVRLKLHKKVLKNDKNSASFTSKVLTSYFKEKHSRSPSRKVKEVSEMFKQKMAEDESKLHATLDWRYSSGCDSPQISGQFYSTLSAPPSPDLLILEEQCKQHQQVGEDIDSPRVSGEFAAVVRKISVLQTIARRKESSGDLLSAPKRKISILPTIGRRRKESKFNNRPDK